MFCKKQNRKKPFAVFAFPWYGMSGCWLNCYRLPASPLLATTSQPSHAELSCVINETTKKNGKRQSLTGRHRQRQARGSQAVPLRLWLSQTEPTIIIIIVVVVVLVVVSSRLRCRQLRDGPRLKRALGKIVLNKLHLFWKFQKILKLKI